jgi:hypothetical protein
MRGSHVLIGGSGLKRFVYMDSFRCNVSGVLPCGQSQWMMGVWLLEKVMDMRLST